MLPFLKNRDRFQSGLIVKTREPDQKPEESTDDHAMAIESCVDALISAIHAKDTKAAAQALKDAFTILETLPHDEVDHIEPHSYDSQNQKAVK